MTKSGIFYTKLMKVPKSPKKPGWACEPKQGKPKYL